MFFINLYNFIFGEIIIKIIGNKPERFLNALINLEINFKDLEKISDNELNFKLGSKYANEYALDLIAHKMGLNCTIIKKSGVKYFLERHKMRLGLYLGIITGLALIYGSTFFIWEVKIVKSDYPDKREIIEILESLGVKNGALSRNIDPQDIQSRAILAQPKIAWLAVNIKGTVANIEVKYREPAPEIIDTESPANVIATKSGKIIHIDAYEGTPQLKIDETVEKGGVLISSEVESKIFGNIKKHAAGKIIAETTRIVEIKIPLKITKKEFTGHKVKKNKLNIFGKNVNLYLNPKTNIAKYDKIKSEQNIILFGGIILPMKIVSTEFIEYTEREIILSETEAEQIALAQFERIIENKFGENIIEITEKSCEGEYNKDENYYYAICKADCLENIAQEVLIAP